MNKNLLGFLTRWFVCVLGLWLASSFLSNYISYRDGFGTLVMAGLVLAIVNFLIKPILILFSLPAIVFTLGLFMVIINGFIVFIVSKLYTPLHVTNFWAAIFAGMVIGLVNYLVTTVMESAKE
ncbi:phage holin family protein [bacterium]|nr:phage holin family protein [bacterium]